MKRREPQTLASIFVKEPSNALALKLVQAYQEEPIQEKRLGILELLLRPYSPYLGSIFLKFGANPQEEYNNLYLRAFEKFEREIFPRTNVKSFFAVMARNEMINKNHKKRYIAAADVFAPEREEEDPILKKGEHLRRAMEELPVLQKKALELRYLSSVKVMSYAEIAEEMGKTRGQVKGYLDRGKWKLIQIFAARVE